MTFHVWKRKINTFFPLSLVPNPRHLWPFFHPPPSPSHSRPPCLGRLDIKSSKAPPSAKTFHKWAKLVVGQSAGCSLLMHVLLSCWTWMMAMWQCVSPQCRAITLHNVYMRDYDSPVYKIALYLLQGNNRISMYIRRILAIPLVKSVVDTGEYLRENHEFRVWGSRKLKFTHVPPVWTTWDKYMLNKIIKETF